MVFSEHLSRNVLKEKSKDPTCQDLEMKIYDVYLNTSSEKCISLAAEMSKDETLVTLKNQIIKGWPPMRSECLKNLQDYWNYHDELRILDGLILMGTCIVIPDQCREELLAQLHEGHFVLTISNLEPDIMCIGLASTRTLKY